MRAAAGHRPAAIHDVHHTRETRIMRSLGLAFLVLLSLVNTALADQEKVGRKPPHYLGKAPAGAVTVVRLPILTGASFGDPGPQKALLDLIDAARPAIEAALDSLTVPGLPDSAGNLGAGAPAVYVGSREGFYAPPPLGPVDEPAPARDAVWIRTTDPNGAWKKRIRAAARDAGASHVLVVTLELSDYPVRQKNWKGSKAVDLAAGHTMPVAWLTSLDQPVEVLQWTGSLLTADGKLVRAGAEAFHALRTPFGESALGLQRAITPEVMERALAARRDDVAGTPPAWRVAMANLVAELAGRPRVGGGSD